MNTSLLICFSFSLLYKQMKLSPSGILDDIAVLDAGNIGDVRTRLVHQLPIHPSRTTTKISNHFEKSFSSVWHPAWKIKSDF